MIDYTQNPTFLSIDPPSRSAGKVAFRWVYLVKQAEGRSEKYPIDIMLRVDEDGKPFFSTHCPQIPKPLEDTDIERLRGKVWAEMDSTVGLSNRIKWEDWLEVRVKGSDRDFDLEPGKGYDYMRSSLEVQVKKLKRGLHPDDGRPLTLDSIGKVMSFPKPVKQGEIVDRYAGIKLQGSGLNMGSEDEVSYIPATPENMVALEEIMRRMKMLRLRLSDVLGQDQIMHQLARFDVLPAIENKTTEEDK